MIIQYIGEDTACLDLTAAKQTKFILNFMKSRFSSLLIPHKTTAKAKAS